MSENESASRGRRRMRLLVGTTLIAFAVSIAVAFSVILSRNKVSQASIPAPVQKQNFITEQEPVTVPSPDAELLKHEEVVKAPKATSADTPKENRSVKPDFGNKLISGAAAIVSVLSRGGGNEGQEVCRVANADELRVAITTMTCPVILLTENARDAYIIEEEIIVSRSIVVMGSSVFLPYLDCAVAVRAFRVVAGGYLELQFVRVNIGKGEIGSRWEWSWRRERELQLGGQGAEAPPGGIINIRGGTVLFEPGAVGGSFNGVYFTSDQTSFEDVQIAIEQTINLVGIRLYGGHVFIADGDVSFNGCVFYDLEILTPFSDRIYFGGDVLVLAGTARFTACAWFYTTILGMENGLGFNIAVMGGAAMYTGCYFQEQNIVAAYNGLGQAFLVAGGVQIITGCNFIYFSAVEFFSGTGEMTVCSGVMVVTGVSWEEFYGLFSYYGAGLDYAVLTGVMVMTGTSLNQWTGPIWGSVAGDYVFVGAGSFTSHGGPWNGYSSIGGEAGSGGITYIATGTAVFIACPIFDVAAIWTCFMIGEYYAVSSGFFVLLFSPSIEISAIEYFGGLGGTHFVGAGAAVLGWSPLVELGAIKNEHFDYWIMGTCEPDHNAFAPGPAFFVPPGLGCTHHEEDGRRHHRALSSSSVAPQSRDLLFGSPKDINLLAMNLTKIRGLNQEELFSFSSSYGSDFPLPAIKAAREYQRLRKDLGAAEESSSTPPALVHVNGERIGGYCGICNVDSVSGAGLSSCEVHADSCQDMIKAPPSSKSLLQVARQDKGQGFRSFHDLDYKEHFVILADLDAVVKTQEEKDDQHWRNDTLVFNEEEVKNALIHSLAQDGDGAETLQITVYNAEADPMLKEIFPEYYPDINDVKKAEFHRRQATEVYDTAHRYKIGIVATSQDRSNAILNRLKASNAQNVGIVESEEDEMLGKSNDNNQVSLEDDIKSYLYNEKGIETGALSISFEKMMYVPAYNSKNIFAKDEQAATGSKSGIFSITLMDPDYPILPLTHANFNSKYSIGLENFPPNSQIQIKLLQVEADDNAIPKFGKSSMTISTVTTDSNGQMQVPYTFQETRALIPGDYYLQAVDSARGMYGSSSIFSLTKGKKRRKLYGPIMWV